MKPFTHANTKRWIIVGGLLFLTSFNSVGYAQATSLTTTEKNWLTFMCEEEKVARDVYLFLYDMWGAPIFNNISNSEQTHMDAIKTLLDRYRLADPMVNKSQGEFANPELQALYNELIEQGSLSFIDALNVGVLIEETDIDDLKTGIGTTNHKDIKNVYNNLLRGSINHLKAFTFNLTLQGEGLTE